MTIEDGRIDAVAVQPAGRGGTAVPGFVDAHINGFAGVDFLTYRRGRLPAGRRRARAHRRRGLPAHLHHLAARRVRGATRSRRRGCPGRSAGSPDPGGPSRGPLPVAELAGRARPRPPAGPGLGARRAAPAGRPRDDDDRRPRAARRARARRAAGGARSGGLVRPLGRRRRASARRVRRRRARDHPRPQRAPALAAARPRPRRRGAGAARRDRAGDRGRRAPRPGVGLRGVPRRGLALLPRDRRHRGRAARRRRIRLGGRTVEVRDGACGWPTARWQAAS